MYSLGISRDFIAQHYLIGGDWGDENTIHSHHYRVEVVLQGSDLTQHGYLIDIVELERVVAEIIACFRDRTLNDSSDFRGENPSLERFARIFWESLQARLSLGSQNLTVKLWENDADWAGYTA